MAKTPRILISPHIEAKGDEMSDLSVSLSFRYQGALMRHGALPLILAATTSPRLISEAVRASDGVLLTGGDDVEPDLYEPSMNETLRKKVSTSPDGGRRDYREFLLISEVFKQKKPLLAICRGHQVLNVALGGTLHADVSSLVVGAMNHRRMDRKADVVHEVRLTPGCLLAKITSKRTVGVNSTHHQAAARPAAALRVTGVARDGVIECLELKPESMHMLPFLLSVQFHPERLADRYPEHDAIFRAFTSACMPKRKKL